MRAKKKINKGRGGLNAGSVVSSRGQRRWVLGSKNLEGRHPAWEPATQTHPFPQNVSKMLAKYQIAELCKGLHFVDLGESFPTSIQLQNLASIQPRTSPSKSDCQLVELDQT